VYVRAPEPIDRLVGVADRDQVAPVARQLGQQQLLRRVGVLVFVHEHHLVRRPLPLQHLRPGQQRGGGPDQLRVVVGLLRVEVEPVLVTIGEAAGRDPVAPAVPPAHRDQALAVEAAFVGPG
jgi:hypothetical protein